MAGLHEQKRSQSDALLDLRGVFEQMPAALCLLRGPRHIIEFANGRGLRLVGGRDVLGLTVADAIPEVRGQGFIDLLDEAYRTGERFVGHELSVVLAGDDVPFDVVADVTFQPLRGRDGSVEGILVHAVDDTETVQARKRLDAVLQRELEDRFRKAVDSMIDTVLIAAPIRDATGSVVDFQVGFVNDGSDEIGQRQRDQLVGRRFSELWPNIASSGLLAREINVIETGEPLILDNFSYNEWVGDEHFDSVFDVRGTRLDGELFLVVRDVSERVARERALADSRSRLVREQEAVLTLQAAILPRQMPSVPGVDVAAEYVAAYDNLEVGGDWFDVSTRPDGVVAIAIGDVAGKGIEAAQVMAQVRAAGRVAGLTDTDPAGVLSAQNAFMLAADLGPFATSVFALYEPWSGALSWASAGHLPPLLVSGGDATLLTGDGRPPLGAVAEPGYHTMATNLAAGDRVVLYTDGLVERRGESIEDGLARLVGLAPRDGTAAAACRELLDALGVAAGSGDDVCVLTLDRLRTC